MLSPTGVYAAFQRSGISHVVAVSGLHIGFLAGLLTLLFGKRSYLSAVVGMLLMFFFAAVAGFTPSALRAAFMSSLLLLAPLAGRELGYSFACFPVPMPPPASVFSFPLRQLRASIWFPGIWPPGGYRQFQNGISPWASWPGRFWYFLPVIWRSPSEPFFLPHHLRPSILAPCPWWGH